MRETKCAVIVFIVFWHIVSLFLLTLNSLEVSSAALTVKSDAVCCSRSSVTVKQRGCQEVKDRNV